MKYEKVNLFVDYLLTYYYTAGSDNLILACIKKNL